MAEPSDSSNVSFLGSVHLSLSNIISYGMVSGLGMIAFYFAFQGTLLAYYPSIQSALLAKKLTIHFQNIPIGKIAASAICVLALVLNLWAKRMVELFGLYMKSFLVTGAALELSANLAEGPYAAILAQHDALGDRGHGVFWTMSVVFCFSAVWFFLAMLPWST